MIVPSVGTFSPGRTIRMSPGNTCSIGTLASPSRVRIRACLAPSSRSAVTDRAALPFAFASNARPRVIRVMMMAAVSKNTSP